MATSPVLRNPWPSGNPEPVFQGNLLIDGTLTVLGGILGSIYGIVDAIAYATNPSAPTEACVAAAFASGASIVVCSKPIAINNPMPIPQDKTLILSPGNYLVGNNGNIQMAPVSTLTTYGGCESTYLSIPQTYTRTDGIIDTRASGQGTGQIISGLGIFFSQPSTATRTSMVHYPPAIVGSTRMRVLYCKITEAWIGLDFSQGTYGGGALVEGLQISSYNQGVFVDNTLDTFRLSNCHFWPFSLTTDSNKMAAYVDSANIGLVGGRVDDLDCSNCEWTIGTGVSLALGAGVVPGAGFGSFTNCGFDTYNGMVVSAGHWTISSSYFSVTGTCNGLFINGGSVTMSAMQFTSAGGNCFVNQGGGSVQIAGAQVARGAMNSFPFYLQNANAGMIILGMEIDSSSVDQVIFANAAGYMDLTSIQFNFSANIVYTQPRIVFSTTGSRGRVMSCKMSDLGTGSAAFWNIEANVQFYGYFNMLLGSVPTPSSSSGLINIGNNF